MTYPLSHYTPQRFCWNGIGTSYGCLFGLWRLLLPSPASRSLASTLVCTTGLPLGEHQLISAAGGICYYGTNAGLYAELIQFIPRQVLRSPSAFGQI